VLKISLLTLGIAVCLGAGHLAEARQSATQESQTTPAAPAATSGTMVHLEACLYPKRAISASVPLIVPVGAVEDFVVTDIELISGSSGATDAVFKVEQVAANRLRGLSGKRVGVTGRIEVQSGLPLLKVTSIREIVGSCPALPASRS
jgi:hypothetical protein